MFDRVLNIPLAAQKIYLTEAFVRESKCKIFSFSNSLGFLHILWYIPKTRVMFLNNDEFWMSFHVPLPAPYISESCIKIKVNLNIYFRTSLWCFKRFYEGLIGLHKTL